MLVHINISAELEIFNKIGKGSLIMRYFRLKKRLKPFLPNVGLRRKLYGDSSANLDYRNRLTLGMPATYRIRVQGFLEKRWADRLGGMNISERSREVETPLTILVGRMRDQAELSGVLNSLYELHLVILSVGLVGDE